MRPRDLIPAALLAVAPAFSFAVEPVNLSSPSVVKLDWNTIAFISSDVDGDGRRDLVVLNNDSGKVEILYQNDPAKPRDQHKRSIRRNRWEPVLEDAPFTREGLMMGAHGFDVCTGDFNGDGRIDVAFTGDPTALTVIYQDAEGQWEERWTYDEFEVQNWTMTTLAVDVDNDSRTDLVVLAKDELLVFYQKDGALAEPRRYKLSTTEAHDLRTRDVDDNGLSDLLYLCGNDEMRRICVRLQTRPGFFGPEIIFPMQGYTIGLSDFALIDGRKAFATLDGRTRMLATLSLASTNEKPSRLSDLRMRDNSLQANVRSQAAYTWGDFDGDGRTDIAAADPSGARLILFRQGGTGDFGEGQPYPSLSKISSISTLHREGQPDAIAIASNAENVLGIVEYTEKGRLGFPALIRTVGKPIAAATGDFGDTGMDGIACLEKRDDKFFVVRLAQGGDGTWTNVAEFEFADLRRSPEGIACIQVDGKGPDEVIVFFPKDAARIVAVTDGGLAEIAAEDPLRLSCMNGIDQSRIAVEDMDGDGDGELLVAATGYIRGLSMDESGAFRIADQYNSRSPEADIRGPVLVDMKGDGTRQLLFYDDKADRLELLAQDSADGVFRSVEELECATKSGYLGMTRLRLGPDGAESLLMMAPDLFSSIPLDKTGWCFDGALPPYETELEGVMYTNLETGDLNGDGVPEVVLIDGRKNIMDIVMLDEEGALQSVMHFVVFNENPYANSRSSSGLEPREIVIDDLNGDGLNDIAILVHDRILVYFSTRIPAANDSPAK